MYLSGFLVLVGIFAIVAGFPALGLVVLVVAIVVMLAESPERTLDQIEREKGKRRDEER